MKTYFITCALVIAALTVKANTPKPDTMNVNTIESDNYVKTTNNVLHCSKITFGPTKAKLILDNGSKITLMNNELLAYKKDGKIFEKVPLYYKDKNTNRVVFMEFLKYTNGMKLYRYRTYEESFNPPVELKSMQPVEKYYVFKNGNYHLQIDKANYKTVFAFFGINATLE